MKSLRDINIKLQPCF